MQQFPQVRGHLRFDRQRLAGRRVRERQARGVQRLPLETAQYLDNRLGGALGQGQSPAVDRVPDQRVPSPREMHSYLVRSSRLEAHTDVGK